LTYRRDCGGQKFFRNDSALCGENNVKPCNCGSTQNSHGKLLVTFGANEGAQLIGPPTSAITMPTTGQLGANVSVAAGSKRGVSKVELIINGFKWGELKGATFGPMGQLDPSTYQVPIPAELPNSIVDVVARACDDLARCTDSPTVTLTKGAACADASTCAKGQKCEAGKCFWDPAVGQIGDTCTYNQFCESLMCAGDEGAQVCSKNCVPNTEDACPEMFECIPTGVTAGFCYPKDESGGGCCSVGDDDDGPSQWFVHGGLSLAMLGLLVRRRRTRK
jgi:MYXO-CTERM domain-containing protein